jgi:hypothetical protein
VRQRFKPDELLITEFTCVMGAHTGPGFVGVAFFSGQPIAEVAEAVGAHSAAASNPTLDEDVATLESSLRGVPASRPRPALVLVSGLPGSGKSYFSRELCSRYPLAHLDSDALRRALFPRPTHGGAENERLFAAVHALLESLLARGVSAVLDATSLKEEHRRPLYEIADKAGARLVIVQTEAPPDVARQRLEARARGDNRRDASEATVAVYDRMAREMETIERPHMRVDTSIDIEPALADVLQQLAIANRV